MIPRHRRGCWPRAVPLAVLFGLGVGLTGVGIAWLGIPLAALALKQVANPFAYLSGEATWPRDPRRPSPEWKAALARHMRARAAVERDQRWSQAVHRRDEKVQHRLDREARR